MEHQLSSPLRPVARKETALESVELAIEVFDKLFQEVATVNLYNEPDIGGDLKIPMRNLTDKQCRSIKDLSGHIISIKRNLMERRDSETNPARLTERLAGIDAAAGLHTARKFSLLQEYLVNELNRSETAELQLKAKEDELVLVTAERDKLKKRLAMGSSTSSQSFSHLAAASAPTSAAASSSVVVKTEATSHSERGDTNPLSYVGGYIRKPFGSSYFFGLIAAYLKEDAFFQIVYEDADYEDLSFAEMRRVLWSGSTPTAKRDACTKHAKLLGILTEEQGTAMAAQGAATAAGQPPAGKTAPPFLQSAKDVSSSGVKNSELSAAAADISSSSSGSSGSARSPALEKSAPSSAPSAAHGVRAVLTAATVSDTSSSSSSSGTGGDASDNDSSRDSADRTTPKKSSALAAAPEVTAPTVTASIARAQSSSSLSSLPAALSHQSIASASSSAAAQGNSSEPGMISAPVGLPSAGAGAAADKPASNPASTPASKPASNPASKPAGAVADKPASKPASTPASKSAGVPRLLELQQIARMHHPAPSLSAVSGASKEKPKSLSHSQPSHQTSKPSSQPLAAQPQQVPFSQLSSTSADTVVEAFQEVGPTSLSRTATTGTLDASSSTKAQSGAGAPVKIPPNTLTALVRANQAKAGSSTQAMEVDAASDDSSVVFLETRSNGAVELVAARGGKRAYLAAGSAAVAKKPAADTEKTSATSSARRGGPRTMETARHASHKRKADDPARDEADVDAAGKKKSAAEGVNVVPLLIN